MRCATRHLSNFLSLSLAVLTAHAVTSAEAPSSKIKDEDQARTDQARILGKWRVIGSIGAEEIPQEAFGTEVEFTAESMIFKPKNANGPGDWVTLRYGLDPAHDPKHIDTRHRLSSDGKPFDQLGIYSLEDGELRFGLASAGQPRPADFRSIPQAFVLERVEEP